MIAILDWQRVAGVQEDHSTTKQSQESHTSSRTCLVGLYEQALELDHVTCFHRDGWAHRYFSLLTWTPGTGTPGGSTGCVWLLKLYKFRIQFYHYSMPLTTFLRDDCQLVLQQTKGDV